MKKTLKQILEEPEEQKNSFLEERFLREKKRKTLFLSELKRKIGVHKQHVLRLEKELALYEKLWGIKNE